MSRVPACGGRPVVAGVDGCRGGWVVARAPLRAAGRGVAIDEIEWAIAPAWRDVVRFCRGAVRIAVDMPIGLPDAATPGGRACDRAARGLLGRRASSVFSPPVRGVLAAETYRDALLASRASSDHELGLSKQAWNLVPKVRELDEWMTPRRQRRVRECHPEVVFALLNGGDRGGARAMAARKTTAAGRAGRLHVLAMEFGVECETLARLADSALHQSSAIACDRATGRSAKPDDVIDALACLAVAMGMASGDERWAPPGKRDSAVDARGLTMEIAGVRPETSSR